MANYVYNGFQYYGSMHGGTGILPQSVMRETANNYGTSLFQGDLLIPVSDGTVAVAAVANPGGIAYVATGFSYVISNKRNQKPYLPANTTFTPTTVGSPQASHVEVIMVMPDMIWAVNGSSSTGITTIAGAVSLIGENCNFATGSGGNTTSGVSSHTLDISSHNTTTKNFRVVGIIQYPSDNPESLLLNNDPTLTLATYLVTCNEGFWPPYLTAGL